MTVAVNTRNIQVNRPIQVTLRDRSGAHTELTLFVHGKPPIAVAFDYHEGDFNAPIDLEPGQYRCTFIVQVYHYDANKTLNPAYNVECLINGKSCADANGSVKANSSDAGSKSFNLTVV